MTGPTRAPRPHAALARELADFLIDLSIALHKHAMYPEGHPSLAPATEAVIRRLDGVLKDRASLSLGVARHQLVIEGVATDPDNAVLQELAGRLHRHHLGGITFRRGLTPAELEEVLHLLSVEADRGEPLGLGPAPRLAAWTHLRLYPLNYDRLRMADGDRAAAEKRPSKTRATQLWFELSRAALGSDAPEEQEEEDSATPPAAVAQAIQHGRDDAYDQVIVGYLLQIAEEMKRGGGETADLRQRISELIQSLDQASLTRLLSMGGDAAQRRRFVLDASDTVTVEAVIDLVRAASAAEQDTVSHALLRMLHKLGQQGAQGAGRRRALADRSVREQVAELIRGWTLRDPHPETYRDALQSAVRAPSAGPGGDKALHQAEPQRVLQMALELNVKSDAVNRAVREVVASGQLASLTDVLEGAGSAATAEAIWQQLTQGDVIRAVVTAEPIETRQLDVLLYRAGLAAAEPMLDALTASASRQARRVLLDRIVKLGPGVGPLVLQRLADVSWYVQRNMLAILAELPERPPEFDARPFLEHTDARVRREALRLLLRDGDTRERAIHCALADPDERAMRLGLATAAEQGLPESAVSLVASLAVGGPNQELRVTAIRALGAARVAAAADTLLRIVTPRKRWFRRPRLARTPEVEAALTALESFADDPRVRRALAELKGS